VAIMYDNSACAADGRLPSFIVIGAMKAGTTSLHRYLSLHPELSMPITRKELNFFNVDRNWNRGVEWYKGVVQ